MKKRVIKKKEVKGKCGLSKSCDCGAVYGLGLIGALIYYISTATSFLVGVVGVLKAIVWPAVLVFEAMKFLVV